MKTSEILNKAADLIQERGWGQGPDTWYADKNAGLCLEGGIAAAMGQDMHEINGWESKKNAFESCPAYTAVREYLAPQLQELKERNGATVDLPVYAWNDQRTRTASEVIEVLRATALIESAKENSSVEVPVTA